MKNHHKNQSRAITILLCYSARETRKEDMERYRACVLNNENKNNTFIRENMRKQEEFNSVDYKCENFNTK